METGFFKNPVADLDKEAKEHWPELSKESAKVVADTCWREFERLTEMGDEKSAGKLADDFDAGISLRDIDQKHGLGIPGKIILESEGMVLGGGGSGSG